MLLILLYHNCQKKGAQNDPHLPITYLSRPSEPGNGD